MMERDKIKEAAEAAYPLESNLPGPYRQRLAFINGATSQAAQQYWADKQQEWISVNDELPTLRINHCLVFNSDAPEYNQHIFTAIYFTQTNSWNNISNKYAGSITHWMPMPNYPKPINPNSWRKLNDK